MNTPADITLEQQIEKMERARLNGIDVLGGQIPGREKHVRECDAILASLRSLHEARRDQGHDFYEAYRGARDDMLEWKRRALRAERESDNLARALADQINGRTFMGEPVEPKRAPSYAGYIRHHSTCAITGTPLPIALANEVGCTCGAVEALK